MLRPKNQQVLNFMTHCLSFHFNYPEGKSHLMMLHNLSSVTVRICHKCLAYRMTAGQTAADLEGVF
jgi:hypothetical protein